MSTGVRLILHEEAWKSERVINAFRSVVWTGGGIFAVTANRLSGGPFQPWTLLVLAWGLASLLLGVFYLRKRFGRAIPILVSTLDLLVLTLAIDHLYEGVQEKSPLRALHLLYGTGVIVMVLIAVNVLRYSPAAVVWSVVCGCGAYGYLLAAHGAWTFRFILEAFLFAGTGGLFLYASLKLRKIVRRVKERDAFARFLPSPVVDQLTRDPLALGLGGDEIEATILFADLRDFTSMSERMAPAEVVALLNGHFEAMVDEIFRHGGILDKFIGDGICAVFTPSVAGDGHAARAIDCAQAMLARVRPPLRAGIGIHTGRVIAGNIGTATRMEYTHIGDAVNTASRVEGLCKDYGVPLVVTASALRRAGREGRRLGAAVVKGKSEAVEVFTLPGPSASA